MIPDLYKQDQEWYAGVQAKFPEKVVCKKGCFDCCLGLFDISLLDAALLREGLAQADPAVRADIVAKAQAIMEQISALRPDLRGEPTLESLTPDEVDTLCDEMKEVRCPVLGEQGECRLYDHRPLVCRLNGVPLTLIVDTGADRTVISPEVIERAGLGGQAGRAVQVVGVTGTSTASLVTLPLLDIAGARIGPVVVVVYALPATFRGTGSSEEAGGSAAGAIEGLLGRDVLDAFTLNVDTGSGRATLTLR